jgi:hypothetical protein
MAQDFGQRRNYARGLGLSSRAEALIKGALPAASWRVTPDLQENEAERRT